jgi:hypothetical protein
LDRSQAVAPAHTFQQGVFLGQAGIINHGRQGIGPHVWRGKAQVDRDIARSIEGLNLGAPRLRQGTGINASANRGQILDPIYGLTIGARCLRRGAGIHDRSVAFVTSTTEQQESAGGALQSKCASTFWFLHLRTALRRGARIPSETGDASETFVTAVRPLGKQGYLTILSAPTRDHLKVIATPTN